MTMGALSIALGNQFVELQPGLGALAVAQPADARRQPLEGHLLARHVQPAVQVLVFGEELQDGFVGAVDILRVAGERHPAEGPFALAEQRADVGRHKAGKLEGIVHAVVKGALAQVVAVIEHLRARLLEIQHGLHMARPSNRSERCSYSSGSDLRSCIRLLPRSARPGHTSAHRGRGSGR